MPPYYLTHEYDPGDDLYADLDAMTQDELEHGNCEGGQCVACGECLTCCGDHPCFDGGPHEAP